MIDNPIKAKPRAGEPVVGVMTPMVNSREDAQRAVDSEARANEMTLVIPQIETLTAVEAADEIIATEGVDVIFLGPTDLSVAGGVPGQSKHQIVWT